VEQSSQVIEPWVEADVRETIATMENEGKVVGSVCDDCGLAAFPPVRVCRNCQRPNQTLTSLGDRGTLYSYTTVHVASGRPVPYTVGYIDLERGVRILGPLAIPEDQIACDVPVALTQGESGWAFQIEGGQS